MKVDARPVASMTQTACRSQTTAATKGGVCGGDGGEERGTQTGSWTEVTKSSHGVYDVSVVFIQAGQSTRGETTTRF